MAVRRVRDLGDLPLSDLNCDGRRKSLTVSSRTADFGDTKLYLTSVRRISLLTKMRVSDANYNAELIYRAAWSVCCAVGYIDSASSLDGPKSRNPYLLPEVSLPTGQ